MVRLESAVRNVELIGAAAGLGAPDASVALGPAYLQAHRLEDVLAEAGIAARWSPLLAPRFHAPRARAVREFCGRLGGRVHTTLRKGAFPLVFGGDHSVAAGTWRGVADFVQPAGGLGLLWIDAHMDAHTLATTPSHGFMRYRTMR